MDQTQKRTGWVRKGIPEAESIADHMYRMSVLALMSEDQNLDIFRCVALAVVHDLAEAEVGDITPFDGISKEEKQRMETVRTLPSAIPPDTLQTATTSGCYGSLLR